VTRIGFTGHQDLGASTQRDVAAVIAALLADQSNGTLIGLTNLAEGADQLFAFTVLAAGGELQVVVASQGYERSFRTERAEDTYTALLTLAADTTTLPFSEPSEDAYLAAGQEIVNRCDMLLAVWDGRDAAGKGGTGDIVAYARERGVEVRVVWPDGAKRG
jgi:hypothetical protein